MKYSKIFAAALVSMVSMGTLFAAPASAQNTKKIKVYINPGHGGHDPDDRNVVIAPYTQGDPEGYWESNSNLEKGLALRDMLLEKGYDVEISRVTNTSADDLGLSTIVNLSNNSGADIFFSIHSNATGTEARRNFPLMLYRGYDNEPVIPNSDVIAKILNKYLLQNKATYWTSTNINCRGDFSFYPTWHGAGLGVLRGNTRVSMLSEGSFHDYIPETYRLMNKDFCWMEAWHFRKAIDEYFNQPGVDFGVVAGRLNDNRTPRDGSYLKFGDDWYATIQGAKVELIDTEGKVVDTYTTETKHINGFYLFRKVTPGHYTVKASCDTHYPISTEIDVVADEITYANMQMGKIRNTPPEVVAYSPMWKDGDEPVLCNCPVIIDFNWDMDTESAEKAFSISPATAGTFSWEDINHRLVFTPSEPYKTNTKYTVTISTEAKHPDNMNMENPFTFSFMTTNFNYMKILGQFPKQDEKVHYSNAAIEFRFDLIPNVAPILKQITCTDSKGNNVSFNKRKMTNSKAGATYGFFRIPFLKDLTVGETYNLTLAREFADKNGITLQEPVNVTFTAVDAAENTAGQGIIDNMETPADYSIAEVGSLNLESQSVTAAAHPLVGKAVDFTYKFKDTEGGEILWERAESAPQVLKAGEKVGVHISGDLTANKVYLELTSDVSTTYTYVCDMDFLGWRYFEIPVTVEADAQLTGIKLVQNPSQMSAAGTFAVDDIKYIGSGAVEDIECTSLIVHPNPASEYLVANADFLITGIRLVTASGITVAQTEGNVLNVSEIADGAYFAIISNGAGQYTRKVLIKH